MTQDYYTQRREAILLRIQRHSRLLSDGRLAFPRSLAADKRQLKKLENEYKTYKNA